LSGGGFGAFGLLHCEEARGALKRRLWAFWSLRR